MVTSSWKITFTENSSKLLVGTTTLYATERTIITCTERLPFFGWVKSPTERLQTTNSHWNHLIYNSSMEQLLRNQLDNKYVFCFDEHRPKNIKGKMERFEQQPFVL